LENISIALDSAEEEQALRNISAKSSRLDKQDAWGPSPARDFRARRSMPCLNRDLSRGIVNAVRTRHQGLDQLGNTLVSKHSRREIDMNTNIELQRDVLDELLYEPSVDPAEIGITAKDGIVTLSGKVNSYAEKWSAVRAAERVGRVRAVVDEITVELPSKYQRTDEDIAHAVLNTLKWDVLVPEERIKIHVENGWIILKGTVDYKHQQIAVENAIRNLAGVKRITNHIKVAPVTTPSEVKTKIENAMRRAAEVDVQKIHVDVRGAKVILRGKVRSWAERNEAERAAWSAPGVTEVDDGLLIAA
jgi:osmotically-inducible protein OsmY